jgi:hypothetical protein
MTDLPALVDADTGFGEPMNVARTVQGARGRGCSQASTSRTRSAEEVRPPRRERLSSMRTPRQNAFAPQWMRAETRTC